MISDQAYEISILAKTETYLNCNLYFNPFKPEFTILFSIHYKPRSEWRWCDVV